MKRLPLFVLLLGLLVLASNSQVATPQEKKTPKANPPSLAVEQLPGGVRFNPDAMVIVGARGDNHSIAVSKDGKRIASAGGSYSPASGFVSVIETESKKELLSLRLKRLCNAVGISPNGKYVGFGGPSGELKVLEVDTGKTVFSKKLDGGVALAFSPDGESLATATRGKTVTVWDIQTGEEQLKLQGATVPLSSITFSADGRKLGASGNEAAKVGQPGVPGGLIATAFVWDIVTHRLITTLEPDKTEMQQNIVFSPDFSAAAGVINYVSLRIWDLASQKSKAVIVGQQVALDLAFSPDGGTIAAARADGMIHISDTKSGTNMGTLGGPGTPCRCVSFTADGKKLVSGANDRSLKLWDFANKKELATLHDEVQVEPQLAPLAMAATSDGALLALSTEDSGIILRDGQRGTVKGVLKGHDDAITCIAFSPDGKSLASGTSDKTIKLWDMASGKNTATMTGHTNWVYALAFSHDGKTIASGSYDKTVRLWDVLTGKEIGSVPAHRGAVRAVAFSPDDKTIASGGSDHFVKLWSVENLELKFVIKGHDGTVRTLVFSPDGKTLASGGEDTWVKLWDPATGKQSKPTQKMHGEEVTVSTFADSHTLLTAGVGNTIRQWDVATGDQTADMPGHYRGIVGIAAASEAKCFFSATADGVIKRFQQESTAPVRFFAGHTGAVQCVSFSPDGKRFVSCGHWPEGDKTLRIWDVQKGNEIFKIDLPAQAAMAAYSPNGKFIASASGDGSSGAQKVYLWNAETGEQVRTFQGHTGYVACVAFNEDGSRLLSSSGDKTVRVWETSSGRELQQFTGHTEWCRRAIFHPDGTHALSAGRDGLVRMWEIETAQEVKQFKSAGQSTDCMALALSRDGKFLAVGGKPSCLVYEVESGKKIAEYSGHQEGTTHLAFTPDGKRIVSTSYDSTARLWDSTTGQELYIFRSHREMAWMASISPDGKWLLTSSGGFREANGKWNKGRDLAVRLWQMPDKKAILEYGSDIVGN